MKTTNFSKWDLKRMTDKEFIAHMREFSCLSQWEKPSAYRYAELRLSHMQGDVYLQTGNISAFRTRPLMKNFVPI